MRFIWLWCLLWGTAGFVFSQNTIGLPLVRNFSKTEFRGGSQTWDIDQDSLGRLYFANNEGLLVFDGSYWKSFALPNKTILRSVKVASGGKIFAGGQGEVGYFSADASGNLAFTSLMGLIAPDARTFADIWNIEIFGEVVFFRTTDRIFEYSNQSVRVHWAPTEWVFARLAGKMMLAQDRQKGLFRWENGIWKPVSGLAAPAGILLNGLISISRDSIMLVAATGNRYLVQPDRITPMSAIPLPSGTLIADVEALNAKEYVLGTSNFGCIVLSLQGKLVQSISDREGMQNNYVLCVFKDRSGNLWAGLNNGLSMIAYNAAVKFIKPNKAVELSGFGARVYKDWLYMATNNGTYGINIANAPDDRSFLIGHLQLISGTSGQSYHFDEVNDALLLAHNEGVFNLSGATASRISTDPAWLFMPMGSVFPASRVLVGKYTGLSWLRYDNNNFSRMEELKGLRESFRFIASDNDGTVWASHPYRGIFRIRFTGDSTSFSHELFTEKNGSPSALDNHVFKVRNRVVFVTEKGPLEFDKKTNRFIPSPFLFPLLKDIPLRYLKEDTDGNIWFVTGKRLGLLTFDNRKSGGYAITYFPELTGQVLSGFENIYPYNMENVFIASEKGIIHINLRKYLRSSRNPTIVLSAVSASGNTDSLVFGGFGPGSVNQKVILPYHENALHFEYSVPAFGFQENIEYSYMLDGYDSEWSRWSTHPEKDYTSLPNGTYTFRVKGRSNLGVESAEVAYTFTIAAPWYKSGFAFFLYFVASCLLVYALLYYHQKKLARQRKLYEEKQEQLRVLHQLEIEKNEKEIIRLQNEKLANEVSFKNRELADTSMHLVEKSDALARVKETLQRLYKSDNTNADLKRAIHLLNDIERNDSDWERFAASFDEINNNFLKKLKEKFPALTGNDLKLCAYLQLNLSSKEIAQLLNISLRGVEISRYRLRKKLGVPQAAAINDFLAEAVR